MINIKYVVFIILFFNISMYLCSQEINKPVEYYDLYSKVEYDINASFRFVFPPPDSNTFAFVDFSAGISYGIIPAHYYIGIAGDIGIGADWFRLIGLFSGDIEYDPDIEYNQFGFSLGARVYNFIKIFNNFKIIPFFGCDFFYVVLPMLYVGTEILFKIIGIEYAYYLPIGKNNIPRHQMSLKIHIPIEDFETVNQAERDGVLNPFANKLKK